VTSYGEAVFWRSWSVPSSFSLLLSLLKHLNPIFKSPKLGGNWGTIGGVVVSYIKPMEIMRQKKTVTVVSADSCHVSQVSPFRGTE
jgi:hypothetical protein